LALATLTRLQIAILFVGAAYAAAVASFLVFRLEKTAVVLAVGALVVWAGAMLGARLVSWQAGLAALPSFVIAMVYPLTWAIMLRA
jgi:hypothetical protein